MVDGAAGAARSFDFSASPVPGRNDLEARAGADGDERDDQKLDQRGFEPLRGRSGGRSGVSHRIAFQNGLAES